MKREQDSWMIDVLGDIEKAMKKRNYNVSAASLSLIRKQLAEEIGNTPDVDNFSDSSNLVQLFA